MNSFVRTAAILFSAGQLVSFSANAASISAAEALNQFNLIVFDDATSSSDVDGRTFVGGNLSGGNYGQHPASTPASAYAGLTVGGNAANLNVNGLGIVTGGNLSSANINSGSSIVLGNATSVNFNGPAYVAGSATASNFNGGHMTALAASAASASAADAVNPAILKAELTGLSQQLSVLGSTGSNVIISGGRATFNAVADANGLAVFDLATIDTTLFKLGEFEFKLNGATTLLFNTDEVSYHIAANFLAGSARTVGAISVWNFYNATDLLIKSEFGGVVLAPDADLTNLNNIEGTVVVNSLTQKGEIHLQPFSGDFPDEPSHDVPEPGLLSLVLAGLGAIVYRRTRRTI
jgi:choice-of-anchor A domain-containing protein